MTSWCLAKELKNISPISVLCSLHFGIIIKLHLNFKKCEFFTNKLLFLGFVVNEQGIEADGQKVEAVRSWSTPESIHDVRSFHGLATFYRRFIKNFSYIAAPLMSCLKNGRIKWGT